MNDYEQIIEMMFADDTLDQSVRQEIEGMNDLQKRLHIVKILDKGLGLFTKIEGIMNLGKMDYIKNILMMLKSYVLIAEVEKKKYGEVMTSLDLIKEMLYTFPDEVWSNPNLKWLDPANGTGPYPIVVIGKLMKGLKDWEPDDEKRYKHIVENMIYVCELQPKNMFLYMCAVDPFDTYKLNVYTGSFLEKEFDYHMKEVWNIEKFDVIIGNPPYNSGGTGTGNTIWHLFVEKSGQLSKRFISFVHPSAWRMPLREGDRFYKSSKVIKDSKIVHMLSKSDSVKYFGLVVKVDYYLIDKEFSEKCYLKSSNGEINMDIKNLEFIPNDNFDLFKRLISSHDRCRVVFSYAYDPRNKFISRTQEDGYNYTLVHTTPKGGNRFVYSSRNDKGHFGIPKVIFGDSGIYDVVIDMNGDYGMTQHAIGIEVSDIETAQLMKTALMSESFSKFLESVSYSNFQIDWRIFTLLKKEFYLEFL